jgi:hypothetical protein
MSPEEIRTRALYLFLMCSQAVEQFAERLMARLPPAPGQSQRLAGQSLRREVGLLFRYWTTRQIWVQLESSEVDAKRLNLALLRLFTERFKLPRDGSGLRYAELSTLAEEVKELSARVTSALGPTSQPLVVELAGGIAPWRDAVSRYTSDALERPVQELAENVQAWAGRTPGQAA